MPMKHKKIAHLKNKLKSTVNSDRNKVEDIEQWRDQSLRLQAELENQSRRFEKQLAEKQRNALAEFVRRLLPVKDSLEYGLASVCNEEDFTKLRDGTESTLKMFADIMAEFGITEVNPLGEIFNPQFHEAISVQAIDELEPNTILVVHQKGYRLGEYLLRPARVVVSVRALSNYAR